MSNIEFAGKYIIKADIKCVTGLHIGGSSEKIEIGGLDNPVIKDPLSGWPFIPGSSLKGKIRSLLEWSRLGDDKPSCIERQLDSGITPQKLKPCQCGECAVCRIFGISAETGSILGPGRLIVRDAFPNDETKRNWENWLGKDIFTEIKSENTINRLTSEANPRSMERVPARSVFELEMIYDLYEIAEDIQKLRVLFQGLCLLEDSALGGSGSRGSGQVKFENITVCLKSLGFYMNPNADVFNVSLNGYGTVSSIFKNFDNISWQ